MNIQTFITNLCEHCGVDTENMKCEITDQDGIVSIQLDLAEEDSGLCIGFRGETLAALQRMIRLACQVELEGKKCILNINNYRQQREEKLAELTRSIALKVLETGNPYTFNGYFPAFERFIIHSTLSADPTFAELESISEGDGKQRLLTIRMRQN